MCYPAPNQFWALPQPELKHKSEDNYPDSENKFFCRSFFFSSCGQYCSWPCNPIPSLQLTIWWAYFSSVTQKPHGGFFFLDKISTGLETWISSSRAREQRWGERKREGGGEQDILILAYNHTPNIELTAELSTQIQSLISAPCIIYFIFTFSFFFHYFWSSHLEQMLVGISAKDKQYGQWKAASLLELQFLILMIWKCEQALKLSHSKEGYGHWSLPFFSSLPL